jgi:Protein of unknown function (DUF2877)
MQCGEITSIGVRAANILRTATLLQVAATFDRCFYLRNGHHFICVGDATIGSGPLNAVLRDYGQHAAQRSPGETVWKSDTLLNFSDGSALSWTSASLWTTPPWPEISQHCALPPSTIEKLSASSPPDGMFRLAAQLLIDADVVATSPLYTRAHGAITALGLGLATSQNLRDAHFQAVARGLIGLGPGLTPSGDDVLAGALLGLDACGLQSVAAQLGAHVAAAAELGTSPLSTAFLHCAIAGETSAILHHALSLALTNADWPTALDSLNRIGHTSGWDHLAGFLLALNAVQSRPL